MPLSLGMHPCRRWSWLALTGIARARTLGGCSFGSQRYALNRVNGSLAMVDLLVMAVAAVLLVANLAYSLTADD